MPFLQGIGELSGGDEPSRFEQEMPSSVKYQIIIKTIPE
jgi:hypothetical protein